VDKHASGRYASVVADVNRVLYEEWAPIGFKGALPRDEYQLYAAEVVLMLSRDASEDDIAEYLTEMAVGFNMGFEAPSREVATRLMNLKAECRDLAS
jgi:hypothetical protein